MSEESKSGSNLKDEFRNLGNNLKQVINAAWESEERQKFQVEIEEGMRELGFVLDDLAQGIREGEVGQNIRREVDDFSERVRTGEVESKAREEILKALKVLNTELEKASKKFAAEEEEQTE